GFMPPEQARGRKHEIDEQSDLWAVGATFFALATGEPVHPTGTAEEMLIACATQPARSLRDVMPVPAAIADVIDRALAFAKQTRWPPATAMQRALQDAYLAACGAPLRAVRLSLGDAGDEVTSGNEPTLPVVESSPRGSEKPVPLEAVSAPRAPSS